MDRFRAREICFSNQSVSLLLDTLHGRYWREAACKILRFLDNCRHGRNWRKIVQEVSTRTVAQVHYDNQVTQRSVGSATTQCTNFSSKYHELNLMFCWSSIDARSLKKSCAGSQPVFDEVSAQHIQICRSEVMHRNTSWSWKKMETLRKCLQLEQSGLPPSHILSSPELQMPATNLPIAVNNTLRSRGPGEQKEPVQGLCRGISHCSRNPQGYPPTVTVSLFCSVKKVSYLHQGPRLGRYRGVQHVPSKCN